MKPALSIVFFTVLSGGGLGLAAVLAVSGRSLPDFLFIAAAVAVVTLTGGGLLASVFHLANPKNAWRSLARIKTSWLSREAAAAILFFLLFFSWTVAHVIVGGSFAWLRVMVLICALVTVFCTAMIYQSLKPIAAWRHPLTAFNYLALSLLSGTTLFAVVSAFQNDAEVSIAAGVYLLTIVAAVGKCLHYRRIGASQNIGHAIGFSQAQARLLDTGQTAPGFLSREFVFECSADKLRRLRAVSLLLCMLAPPASAWLAVNEMPWLSVVAVLLLFAGLLVERWLFFAEARHVVRNYYGR